MGRQPAKLTPVPGQADRHTCPDVEVFARGVRDALDDLAGRRSCHRGCTNRRRDRPGLDGM
ncbi:MAG TPA: hypothetical protein VJ140_15460 [Actinomycetota bacterium]|nr:hypothetical protein [Actinomycetota bacterium]